MASYPCPKILESFIMTTAPRFLLSSLLVLALSGPVFADESVAEPAADEATAEEILEELYIMEFVRKSSYNTIEGKVTVYTPFPQVTLIPMLFLAGQTMVSCSTTEHLILTRSKPLCAGELGENAVLPQWITRDQEFTREYPEGIYGGDHLVG